MSPLCEHGVIGTCYCCRYDCTEHTVADLPSCFARQPGTCAACALPIGVRMRLVRHPDKGWVHDVCAIARRHGKVPRSHFTTEGVREPLDAPWLQTR